MGALCVGGATGAIVAGAWGAALRRSVRQGIPTTLAVLLMVVMAIAAVTMGPQAVEQGLQVGPMVTGALVYGVLQLQKKIRRTGTIER